MMNKHIAVLLISLPFTISILTLNQACQPAPFETGTSTSTSTGTGTGTSTSTVQDASMTGTFWNAERILTAEGTEYVDSTLITQMVLDLEAVGYSSVTIHQASMKMIFNDHTATRVIDVTLTGSGADDTGHILEEYMTARKYAYLPLGLNQYRQVIGNEYWPLTDDLLDLETAGTYLVPINGNTMNMVGVGQQAGKEMDLVHTDETEPVRAVLEGTMWDLTNTNEAGHHYCRNTAKTKVTLDMINEGFSNVIITGEEATMRLDAQKCALRFKANIIATGVDYGMLDMINHMLTGQPYNRHYVYAGNNDYLRVQNDTYILGPDQTITFAENGTFNYFIFGDSMLWRGEESNPRGFAALRTSPVPAPSPAPPLENTVWHVLNGWDMGWAYTEQTAVTQVKLNLENEGYTSVSVSNVSMTVEFNSGLATWITEATVLANGTDGSGRDIAQHMLEERNYIDQGGNVYRKTETDSYVDYGTFLDFASEVLGCDFYYEFVDDILVLETASYPYYNQRISLKAS